MVSTTSSPGFWPWPLLVFTFIVQCCSVQGLRDDQPEVFHPGHRAATVTRLHRYDHSGFGSFLEAERQWHLSRLDDDYSDTGSSFVDSNTQAAASESQATKVRASRSRFLKLSHQQVEALKRAHRAWASPRRVAIHAHHNRQSENQSHDMSVDVRFNGAGHKMSRPEIFANGMAVTGLTSLSSQYVGPIGVGSALVPPECTTKAAALLENASSLVYLPESLKEDPSFVEERRSCHTEDQSQIWVVFDTGSTNIWVSSDLCQHGSCAKKGRRRYNHTASFSYNPPDQGIQLTVEFGTGKIRGPQAIDEFHIGPFTIANQTFGMIEAEEGSVFEDVPFEGILGLAFPSMSAHGVLPFFDNIIQKQVLKNNEFAFYLSPDSEVSNAILWGGVDPAFYSGEIEYFPVVESFYWSIELISFRIGNEELFGELNAEQGAGANYGGYRLPEQQTGDKWKRSPKAILDSGTTFYTAEEELYDIIMDKLPPAPCKTITALSHPPITYRLRNARGEPRDFVINHEQYMTGSGDDECSPAFMRINIPAAHGPAMVLGECFFRQFFVVFDRGDGIEGSARVGLAPSKHDEALSRLKNLTATQPTFSSASVLEMQGQKRR